MEEYDPRKLTRGEVVAAAAKVVLAGLLVGGIIWTGNWAKMDVTGVRVMWFGVVTAFAAPAAWEAAKSGFGARKIKASALVQQVHLQRPLIEGAQRAAENLEKQVSALRSLDSVVELRVARSLTKQRQRELLDRTNEVLRDLNELSAAEAKLEAEEQKASELIEQLSPMVDQLSKGLPPLRPDFRIPVSISSLVAQAGDHLTWAVDNAKWQRRHRKAKAGETQIEAARTGAIVNAHPWPEPVGSSSPEARPNPAGSPSAKQHVRPQ